jgi:hypothetical protein
VEGVDFSIEVGSLLVLSLIPAAAFSEKVRARICSGGVPLSMRWRIFSVMTLVLPEPGPARTSWRPQVFIAVSRGG